MRACLVWQLVALVATSATCAAHISEEELRAAVLKVKGDDDRLMRWDATEHTAEQQANGGCDHLPKALEMMMDPSSSNTMKRMACEYATFCITDNPGQREILSAHEGIHKAIVELVASGVSPSRFEEEEDEEEEEQEKEEEQEDPEEEARLAAASAVSSMAAHLMYISSFANKNNHQSFFENDAIPALSSVIKGKDSTAVQIMWAAAALQNLAASYCDTDDDGRCYWDWIPEQEHLVILDQDSTPIVSDGSKIRQAILEDKELIETLKMLSCWGPVEGDSEDVVFVGENAISGKDDNNPVIIPWAAMGALKNIALEPKAKPLIETIMHCVCYMSSSPDWLEENKGGAVLYHMRRSDPCWFVEDEEDDMYDDEEEEEEEEEEEGYEGEGEEEEEEEEEDEEEEEEDYDENGPNLVLVCVDHNFLDEEGYHCDAYQDATDKECRENTDVFSGVPASTACCECGGGDPHRSYFD